MKDERKFFIIFSQSKKKNVKTNEGKRKWGRSKYFCVKKPLLVQESWLSFVMGLRLFFWLG